MIWVNKKTGALMQIMFMADFDDIMVDVRVKGPVNLLFTFGDFNKQITPETPTPVLTLEELKVRMEDFKKVSDARSRDRQKVNRMSMIINSLNAYKNAKGRFPTTLFELYDAGVLASSTIPQQVLREYFYAVYLNEATLTKANRCTVKGKVCEYYHLGVNLEDQKSPLLESDADVTTDIRGNDSAGCAGENERYCYDVVP